MDNLEESFHLFELGADDSHPIVENNPYALKIQIYADEFDPCSALQSKSGVHKICGVYFSIRNMPIELQSKLTNINLVCLCNANDLKTEMTDTNNILWPILNDLK